MRYIIETNKVEVTNVIRSWKTKGLIEIVEQGDLQESMNDKLSKIKEALTMMKKNGISIDLQIAYLKTETGLNNNDIHKVLNAQNDFFIKLTEGVQK